MTKPLEGLLVLDFSLFLAGPLCALRLADLGARVIKIERPDGGDLCRQLYINDLRLDNDSMLFHTINRGKESFAANLKDPADLARVRKLLSRADVMISNFRPGVMNRLGLDPSSCLKLNPRLVCGTISGYGADGPWAEKPGQDLLAQAVSGVMWLSGNDGDAPTAIGLSVADMFAGHFLCQGILAQLVRRSITGTGGTVETSLLESLLDFQFEVLTTHLNDGGRLPARSAIGNGHAYLGAPYGVYATADGWLAIAMNPLEKLAPLLGVPELATTSRSDTFSRRDELKSRLAAALATRRTAEWLSVLEPADVWCAEVFDWPRLVQHQAFRVLRMTQSITRSTGSTFTALRSPLRLDEELSFNDRPSPEIGEHTGAIRREYGID